MAMFFKIILWFLFWPLLIFYYLIKTFQSKNKKNTIEYNISTPISTIITPRAPKPDLSTNFKINPLTKKWCTKCSDFVVLDFETTGIYERFDEIIEVAALRYKDNSYVESFHTLIKPTTPISKYITSINGISNDMVENSPTISEIIHKLISFIGDSIIVAHNAQFDLKFLKANALIYNIDVRNHYICTLSVSRKMYPELANHKLVTVANHLGITGNGWHRAEFDSRASAEILIKSLQKYFDMQAKDSTG